jgi:stage V sporulation protein B
MQIYNSLLQALDRSVESAKNLAYSGGLKIVGNLVLIPLIGIEGGAVATVLCFTTGFFLNLISYNRLTGNNSRLLKKVAETTSAGVVLTVVIILSSYFIKNNYLEILSAALLGGIVYVIMLMLFKVFDKDEMRLIFGRSE